MLPRSKHLISCVRYFPIASILAYLLLFQSAFAQDTTRPATATPSAPPPVYTALAYIKVKPGKTDAYLDLIKTYSKKVFQAQVKDSSILGWYLNQVLMPSGSNIEYDFVGVTVTRNLREVLDPISSLKESIKKNFPNLSERQLDELVTKYTDTRSIVKREIFADYTWAARPDSASGAPAKYVQVTFQQPKPGKMTESLNWEKNTWGPIHKACIQMGSMKNWAVFVLQMPNDIHNEYSYITANFFDTISQFEGDFKYEDAFRKAWPDMTVEKIMAQPGADKTAVKNQLFRLVEYANATNSK
jgi:hypothetical protein